MDKISESSAVVDAIPARLGRYRLLEHVASGGMADVFRAKSTGIAGFEKILAIKLIRPNIAQEPRFIRSFIDEARIAVTLNHRNIVQVFDFGKAEHRLFLAMELIEGIDLRTALSAAAASGYDVPASIACYIVTDLAAGLDYAHRKADNEGQCLGIVHCDVSPHNIMLSYEGFIKILDFGVARARFATTPEERRLRGKPRYMAPEQTRGDVPTPATDSFALGIVAWELFTGLPLFEGNDVKDILRAVRRADAPEIRKLNPDVPRYLSDAIARALNADPSKRISVGELAETAARAARELATVASSRALADWLSLIKPASGEAAGNIDSNRSAIGSEPSGHSSFGDFPETGTSASTTGTNDRHQANPVRSEPNRAPTGGFEQPEALEPPSGVFLAPEDWSDEPSDGTRTNIIVASDLAADSEDSPATPAVGIDGESTSTSSAESDSAVSIDRGPIAEKLLREKRHVVATCALLEGGNPDITQELVRLLAELAYKRGAVVSEQTHDSIACVFGLEVAGEDDVGSAMQYSLDATELVRETSRHSLGGLDIDVRIGSRAGVIAQRRSDGIHIRGSGVDDARTLARDAEPGHPVLSGGTSRLASAQFSFRELPARKYGSRRLRAFELVGPKSFAERARVLTERRGRFVGRRPELATLSNLLAKSKRDSTVETVALVGRGGVGKSRIAAEFVARNPGVSVFAVAANQASVHAPFSVVVELLQAGVGLPPGRGEQARTHLARRLAAIWDADKENNRDNEDKNRDRVVATLTEAMEVRDGALMRRVQITADLRDRVTAAFRTFRRHAWDSPAIFIVENLQLADAASLEVLRAISTTDGVPGDAALLVVTTRPAAELQFLENDAAAVINIGELEGEERAQLISDRLGGSQPESVAELVDARAGGNPLMIEEVCTAVREFGPDKIPSTARDIVLARVDALPVPVRTALQHAAVAGAVVRSSILEELLGPQTPTYLGELIEEGILIPSDYAAERGDASDLRFRHGLIQEVVYSSLSATGRRRAHRELGELLATRADAGRIEPPAQVAHHLESGGRNLAAARFWVASGELALAVFDAEGARKTFTRAIGLIEEAESSESKPGRNETSEITTLETTNKTLVRALLGREAAAGVLGDHSAQQTDHQRLRELAVAGPVTMADIESRVARRLLRTGEYANALAAARAAEALARDAGDDRLAAEALLVTGEIHERSGDYVKGLNAVTTATELFRGAGDSDGEMRSLVVRGRNCLTRSAYRAARDAYVPVLERLEREPDPLLERLVRNHLAVIELCSGEFERAMSSAQRAISLCQDLGDRALIGDNLSVCGIVLLALGAFEEASDYLDRALAILEETNSQWSVCDCRLYRGVCSSLQGDLDGGLELINQSIAEARELGARYVLANGLTELAGLHLRRESQGRDGQEDARAAEAATREAHEVARDAALVGIEILALSRHAEATVRLGNTMSAVALSTRAVDLLAEQDGIEGSEEEVLYTHCQLLRRTGAKDAESYLELAKASLIAKLEHLKSDGWRKTFTENIAVNAAILLEG